MKILLIAANTRAQGDPTLGIGYIAAYLRKYTTLADVEIRVMNYIPEDLSGMAAFAPDLVGISAMTQQYMAALDLARRLKPLSDARLIIGGLHITLVPTSFDPVFDLGVLGEGERTFLEVVESIANFGFDRSRLREIPGVLLEWEGKTFKAPPRERIEPLDLIPYPARDLFNMDFLLNTERTLFGLGKGRGTNLLTSRGCPFRCRFCSCSAMWGSARYFSPEYVAREIRMLVERYELAYLRIFDDLFAFDKRRLRRIVENLESKGIPEQVTFAVYGRADVLDDELCALLRRLNVRSLEFGLESGTQRILDILKFGGLQLHHAENAVRLSRKYGMHVTAFFIVGIPGETEEEMLQTFEFIRRLQLDRFELSLYTPYPGTDLWEMSVRDGFLSGETAGIDWNRFNFARRDHLTLEDISPGGPQLYVNRAVPPERFVEIYNLMEDFRQKSRAPDWRDFIPETEPDVLPQRS